MTPVRRRQFGTAAITPGGAPQCAISDGSRRYGARWSGVVSARRRGLAWCASAVAHALLAVVIWHITIDDPSNAAPFLALRVDPQLAEFELTEVQLSLPRFDTLAGAAGTWSERLAAESPVPSLSIALPTDGAPVQTSGNGVLQGAGGEIGSGSRGVENGTMAANSEGGGWVFLLDVSAGMRMWMGYSAPHRVSRMETAKRQLIKSISRLDESQQFQVIPISGHVRTLQGSESISLVVATAENKNRSQAWIASVRAAGEYQPSNLLLDALALRPSAVFLLTNGDWWLVRDGKLGVASVVRLTGKHGESLELFERDGRLAAQQVARANTHRIPIHIICFGEATLGRDVLRFLSEQTGGVFRYADVEADDLKLPSFQAAKGAGYAHRSGP